MKNTSYALIFSLLSVGFWQGIRAQDSLRVMSYNLLMYPGGTSYNREADLQYILNDYGPDILGVCELQTEQAADDILQMIQININPHFRRVAWEPNHSSAYDDLHQLVFYNDAKLELIGQGYVTTEIRDINHYTFRLRNSAGDTLDVYELHLKASAGQQNEQKRLRMIQRLELSLDSLPASRYVIVAGDFNLYNSSEPAYTEMTASSQHIPLYDTAGRSGSWHNNSSFADVHSQSTHRNNNAPYDNFVGGGLDDRFDFIMVSGNLLDAASPVHYRTGSYAAYGNNGNCFNQNVNDSQCTGRFSQTLRDHLFQVSDHLPATATFVVSQSFAVARRGLEPPVIYPNPAGDWFGVSGDVPDTEVDIYNPSGQWIARRRLSDKKCYLGALKPGLYYVRFHGYQIPVPLLKN